MRGTVHRAMRSYRDRMAGYATMRAIEVYYARVDASGDPRLCRQSARGDDRGDRQGDRPSRLRPRIAQAHLARRRQAPHRGASADAHQAPRHDPAPGRLGAAGYRETLQEDRRVLLDRYRLTDFALKVVGVGSVGLGAFVGLLTGGSDDDPLFLQAKQAEASVYERYLGPDEHASHGERVVDRSASPSGGKRHPPRLGGW